MGGNFCLGVLGIYPPASSRSAGAQPVPPSSWPVRFERNAHGSPWCFATFGPLAAANAPREHCLSAGELQLRPRTAQGSPACTHLALGGCGEAEAASLWTIHGWMLREGCRVNGSELLGRGVIPSLHCAWGKG